MTYDRFRAEYVALCTKYGLASQTSEEAIKPPTLSRRDHFAMAAITTMRWRRRGGPFDPDDLAEAMRDAVAIADALIAELDKP